MREQFFGDVHDFVTFGFLRRLSGQGPWSLLVAWMLGPSAGSAHHRRHRYLQEAQRFAPCDAELFFALHHLVKAGAGLKGLEASGLIPKTHYFPNPPPEDPLARPWWFAALCRAASRAQVVFLDPDNGLEVPSCPYGTRGSSRYVYFSEVAQLFALGLGVVVFQYLPRVRREAYLMRRMAQLQAAVPEASVRAVGTSQVAFFSAFPPPWAERLNAAIQSFSETFGRAFRLFYAGLYITKE